MKKHYLHIIICFILFGCNQSKDEIAKVEFGKTPYREFISKGYLSEPDRDSTTFRYFLKLNENEKISVTLEVNPDRYRFGKVRQIGIDLGGDTVYRRHQEPSYARGLGARLRDEIDDIYKLYVIWHGQPDSIITFGEFRKREAAKRQGGSRTQIDLPRFEIQYHEDERPFDSNEQIYKAHWNKNHHNIEFKFSMPKMDRNFDNRLVYERAQIIYEMKDYSNELNRVQDSIRKTLTANDLINIAVYNPQWEVLHRTNYLNHDRRFHITLSDIKRKDREEPRGVVAIRFDIVLEDRFGKELYRIEDISYEPQQVLYGAYGSSYIISPFTNELFEIRYHSISRHAEELEHTRIFSQNNRVIPRVIVNAVVFQDGKILR